VIQKCWDADPLKRPKAEEIFELFNKLDNNTNRNYDSYDENSLINQQIIEADEINKQLLPLTIPSTDILSYTTHPQAIYTSRLLDFKNLPEPKNADNNDNSLEYSGNLYISIKLLLYFLLIHVAFVLFY